jgi:hypothetical protein
MRRVVIISYLDGVASEKLLTCPASIANRTIIEQALGIKALPDLLGACL